MPAAGLELSAAASASSGGPTPDASYDPAKATGLVRACDELLGRDAAATVSAPASAAGPPPPGHPVPPAPAEGVVRRERDWKGRTAAALALQHGSNPRWILKANGLLGAAAQDAYAPLDALIPQDRPHVLVPVTAEQAAAGGPDPRAAGRRRLRELTGCTAEEADFYLGAAGWEVAAALREWREDAEWERKNAR